MELGGMTGNIIKRTFKGLSACLVKCLAEKLVGVIEMQFCAFGNFFQNTIIGEISVFV